MHSAIQRLGGALKDLESRIIRDCIKASREDMDFLQLSRKSMAALDNELLGNITASLMAKNTAQRGIISWLNPGVSRQLHPEPIHLRQTLQYLIANAKYEMTGHDVFDIFAAPNDLARYALIETRIHEITRGRSDRQDILVEQGELNTDKMKKMWHHFFPGDEYDVIPCAKGLSDAMKDIVQVAKKVLTDILKSRMYATNSNGKLVYTWCLLLFKFGSIRTLFSDATHHYFFLLSSRELIC